MTTCPVKCMLKVVFRLSLCSFPPLQPQKFAPDAQQLGSAPAFFAEFRRHNRLFGSGKPLASLSGTN